METELRPAHGDDFGSRLDPEPEPRHEFHENETVFLQHQPQPQQFHMMAPLPIQQQSSFKGFFEDDDRMRYIIPIAAFILGFIIARNMNPIIIKST